MADNVDLRTGELTTTNYGWIKPTVGASIDNWGGYLNADLDGIDSTVMSVSNAIPGASLTPPVMDGAVAVGVGTTWARADHVHPTDTSRASVAQVNALPMAINDNRIINGDMRIDQRNNGASGTATGYTVDRWQYSSNQVGKGSWQRFTAGPANLAQGVAYFLNFTSLSAYTSLAADGFSLNQPIEADMISDFLWGTPNAQPVTLSFLATSSLTGTFSGAVKNYAATRSYPFTFTIPTTNVWVKVAITILGDTVGTWVMQGNAGAMYVVFDLGTGSNRRGPANAWASTDYGGVTGAVSVVGTNAATFSLTGVKLEIGSVATPYNRQSLAKSMADCQRYYQVGYSYWAGYGSVGGQIGSQGVFGTAMRAFPTMVLGAPAYGNSSGATISFNNTQNYTFYALATATGYATVTCGYTASAEL